ncbi:hypothetical protein RHGRI_030442 [Rhododendron griersonianum]|uniref:Uncharacterized protein n=1 Tax=Rhododendron griersonianum TaxID=479676 RepID=A0AAV6IS70_9ERIC|nr:hypothetical protein RHGRI_030442 [Rhododendron griersonianum]
MLPQEKLFDASLECSRGDNIRQTVHGDRWGSLMVREREEVKATAVDQALAKVSLHPTAMNAIATPTVAMFVGLSCSEVCGKEKGSISASSRERE